MLLILILFFIFVQYGVIVILLISGFIRTVEKLALYCIPFYWLYAFLRGIIKNIKLMYK